MLTRLILEVVCKFHAVLVVGDTRPYFSGRAHYPCRSLPANSCHFARERRLWIFFDGIFEVFFRGAFVPHPPQSVSNAALCTNSDHVIKLKLKLSFNYLCENEEGPGGGEEEKKRGDFIKG